MEPNHRDTVARGWFVHAKFWKWFVIILTLFCFLMAYAYYSMDNTYLVQIDTNIAVIQSDFATEDSKGSERTFKRLPPKPNAKSPDVGKDTPSTEKSETQLAAKQYKAFKYDSYSHGDQDYDQTDTLEHSAFPLNITKTASMIIKVHGNEHHPGTTSNTGATGSNISKMKSLLDNTLAENQSPKELPVPDLKNLAHNALKPIKGGNFRKTKLFQKLQKQGKNRRLKFDIPIEPDTYYAIRDLESLRIYKTQNLTFVLLVTYARSGSSWLGDITNQSNETFYVFEPLQRLVIQGYYRENLVCFNNNTCRKPKNFTESHNFAITTLHHLFNCQFTKLHTKAVQVFLRNARNTALQTCKRVSTSLKKCLLEAEKVCLATSHRALKTIRISMELVNIMIDLWPNLKVIHLVRDPRAITNSRIKKKTFSMVTKNIFSHSHDMCDRMLKDVQESERNKDKIKHVFYESLAERPLQGAKYIYNFLDLKFTPEVVAWVYNSTHAQEKTGYYGTSRTNATEAANHWQKELPLYKIKIVDSICEELYDQLGFLPISGNPDLGNASLKVRTPILNPAWFS